MNANDETVHSARFLEAELAEMGAHWDAAKLRETAAKLERWIAQMRFKADVLDGRAARRSQEQLN
jgi:hypothetical protein